jgi:hypothetical protein
MLSVIVAVVASVLAALVAVWFGVSTLIAVAATLAVFLVTVGVLAALTRHSFSAFVREMPTHFPSTGTLPGSETRAHIATYDDTPAHVPQGQRDINEAA